MSLSKIVKVSIVAVIASMAISISGCSMFAPEKPSVFSLKIGDCFNDPSADPDDLVSNVEIVDCTVAHDNEIYDHGVIKEESYPGTEGSYARAEEVCAASFFDFIGFTGDSASYGYELEYSYFVPTQDSWDTAGDRAIDCFAYKGNADKITGSLKGAGK